MISFFVPGIPKPKGSKNTFCLPGTRRVVIVDQKSPDLKRWASTVAWEAARVRPLHLWTGPISLTLHFFLPPPKSLLKSRPSYAIKRPDADKLARCAGDALKGVIYQDDAQIVELLIRKSYAEHSGVKVVIHQDVEGLEYQPQMKEARHG